MATEKIPIEANKDSTFYIWDILFLASVPESATINIEDYKLRGRPSTGDLELDRQNSNALTTTWMNIAKMVEYRTMGIPVRILSDDDVKTIYEYIQHHLLAWSAKVQRGLNNIEAPLDDLLAMERFAEEIFQHAKWQFHEGKANLDFSRMLSQLGIRTVGHLFSKPTYVPTTKDEEETPENMRRNSLVAAFRGSFNKGRITNSNAQEGENGS